MGRVRGGSMTGGGGVIKGRAAAKAVSGELNDEPPALTGGEKAIPEGVT